jgi:hypothetical protein
VALSEMALLMPVGGPGTADSLSRWLEAKPSMATLHNGRAYLPDGAILRTGTDDQAERTREYLAAAHRLADTDLRPIHRFLHSLLVTGSTAYGTPVPEDDCDLFAITRRGTLWLVLAYVFLRLRVRSWQGTRSGPPTWCLNLVLDETAAEGEFASPRGFLFAREALTAVPLRGAEEYGTLVVRSPWMEQEAPQLFEQWKFPYRPVSAPRSIPLAVRITNAALYPFLAAYLQAESLYRNWRLRRTGRSAEAFVTTTLLHRLSVQSSKFDELGRVYRGTSAIGYDP